VTEVNKGHSNPGEAPRLKERVCWGLPYSTWAFLVFCAIVLVVGIVAIARWNSVADSIATLVAAVLGITGTHVGHVVGRQQATRSADVEQLTTALRDALERIDPGGGRRA
jgi:fatty acid desaturase